MNHLSLKCWGITTKRIFGLGCSVNVVAVHSRQINPSAEFIMQWHEEAIIWIKTFNVDPLFFLAMVFQVFKRPKHMGFYVPIKSYVKEALQMSNLYIYRHRQLYRTSFH